MEHPLDSTKGLAGRGVRWIVAVVAAVGSCGAAAALADDTAAAPFKPGDISIGEPVALPFARPVAAEQAAPGPATQQPAVAGWLGMSVADSFVNGRWAIVDVAAGGPAAAAGIRPGDELRGVNGRPLETADQVAHALTAIAAGQRIRMTVARADRASDLELLAVPRPAVMPDARDWRPSAAPAVDAPAQADPAATVSVLTNAPPAAPPAEATAPAAVPATLPPAADAPRRAFPSETPPTPAPRPLRGRTALGVRTVPIDAATQERFRLPVPSGAYVIGVVGDLPASKAGIPPGSVIVELADRAVRSPEELAQLVSAGPTDRPVGVRYVLPGGGERRAEVVLQSLDVPLEQALAGEPPLRPAGPPDLQPGPAATSARRPETQAAAVEDEAGDIRREMRLLRGLLDGLERRLERIRR